MFAKKIKAIIIRFVGFVDRITDVYHNSFSLFKVEQGVGENRQNDYEGVKFLSFYGTHILGPILTKNPLFLKEIVSKICKNTDKNFKYKEIENMYEEASYIGSINS